MRVKALEIRWHDTQPIFSADFQAISPKQYEKVPKPHALSNPTEKKQEEVVEKMWRLATAGADKNVRLWLVHPRASSSLPSTSKVPQAGGPSVEYLATLAKHTGPVNVVRFAPIGNAAEPVSVLASAGDDGNILFWIPSTKATATFGSDPEDAKYERESWRVKSQLRSSSGKEIYDLAWSPCGTRILSGAVDYTANIYDVSSGQLIYTIAEHTNYVQGVAWDPCGDFIATQSSDRSMHVYSIVDSAAGLVVHAVGKNTRMELARPAASTKPLASPKRLTQEKGKEVDRTSLASATSTADIFSKPESVLDDSESEQTNSMEPPRPRASSSRRSSSGSLPAISLPATSRSPSTLSSASNLGVNRSILRSPSPAPVPAVHLPLSPKLASAIAPSVEASSSISQVHDDSAAAVKARSELVRLYGDQTTTPFFRRLGFSTDGGFLITPAGQWVDPYANIVKPKSNGGAEEGKKKGKKDSAKEVGGKESAKPTVYIYSRANLARPPIAHLPGHQTTSIGIKFCPILWELRSDLIGEEEENEDNVVKVMFETKEVVDVPLPGSENREVKDGKKPTSLFDLPYRMVYAVATLDVVYLYDTQQAGPICMFGNLHYAPFTDLSWSPDGQTLIASAQDGYCSIVAFEENELGIPYSGKPVLSPAAHHSSLPNSTPVVNKVVVPSSPQVDVSGKAKGKEIVEEVEKAVVEKVNPEVAVDAASTVDLSTTKRSGEGEGEPEKKKPKRAGLIHHGPIC